MTEVIPTRLPSVVLRPWAPAHRDELVRQANDRAVWRNLMDGFPHPYTAADAAGWITFVADVAPSLHLCIEVDGVAAGGIGVIVGEGTERMTGQFGYWLGRAHWGRGLATAAGLAMVEHVRRRTWSACRRRCTPGTRRRCGCSRNSASCAKGCCAAASSRTAS